MYSLLWFFLYRLIKLFLFVLLRIFSFLKIIFILIHQASPPPHSLSTNFFFGTIKLFKK